MTMPVILSSPKLSLMLLLGLLIVTMRGYNTNQQLLGLENDLDNAHWRIRQGGLYRMELLKQIEMAMLAVVRPELIVGADVPDRRRGETLAI